VSVSYAAVALAKRALGSIEGATVLVLGAGEMAELTVRNLITVGVKQVFIANRTFERSVRLAETLKGTAVMFHEISEYLPKSDIIISSLSAPSYLVGKEEMAAMNGKAAMMIDISVPRAIDPAVKEMPNIHLYNIDDLKGVVEQSTAAREKEAQRAGAIIDERVREVWMKHDHGEVAAVIVSLKSIAERERDQALQALEERDGMTEQEKGTIATLTRSMVNRILHHTIEKVREYSNSLYYK
jgi:glutamyl-tRNA reductase